MFPCKFSGSFTAMLAQTYVDVPLDLANAPHLQSFALVQAALRPQYRHVCTNIVPTSEVSACVSDLDWQLNAWISWQCSDGPNVIESPEKNQDVARSGSTISGRDRSNAMVTRKNDRQGILKQRRAASAAAFRTEVASALNISNQNWTLVDVDAALGLQLPPGTSTSFAPTSGDKDKASSSSRQASNGPGGEPFGICGALNAPGPSEGAANHEAGGGDEDWTVLVVGLDFDTTPIPKKEVATLDDGNMFFSELPENRSPFFESLAHWRHRDYVLRDLLGGLVGSGADVRVCVDPPTWSPAAVAAADAACAQLIAFARGSNGDSDSDSCSNGSNSNGGSSGGNNDEVRSESCFSRSSKAQLSCGPCAPPQSFSSSSPTSAPSSKLRVVLVTSARGSDEDVFAAMNNETTAETGGAFADATATAMDRSIALASRWQPWLAAVIHVSDEPPPPYYAWPPLAKGNRWHNSSLNETNREGRPFKNEDGSSAATKSTNSAKPSSKISSTSHSSLVMPSFLANVPHLLEQDPADIASAFHGPMREWAMAWASKLQLLYSGQATNEHDELLRRAHQDGTNIETSSPRSLPPPLVLRMYPFSGGVKAAMLATGLSDDETPRDTSSAGTSNDRPNTPDSTDGAHTNSWRPPPATSSEQRLFLVPVGWYTGYLGDNESGPAAVLKYLGKSWSKGSNAHWERKDEEIGEKVGRREEQGGRGGDGVEEKEVGRNALWSFAGVRGYRFAAVTPQRHAMVNLFHIIGAPHSIHLTDTAGSLNPGSQMISPAVVRDMYQRALVVPSPRGDSLDGFRHYEAIVSGAVPVVDAPSNHPHWSWMVNQRQAEAIRASAGASAQKVNGAALHPTQTKTSLENHTEAWSTRGTGVECGLSVPALGWVFPAPLRVETRGRVTGDAVDDDDEDSNRSNKNSSAVNTTTANDGSQNTSNDELIGFPTHWPPPPSTLSRDWLALLLDRPAATWVPIQGGSEVDETGYFRFTDWSQIDQNIHYTNEDPLRIANATAAAGSGSHKEGIEDTLTGWTLSPWRHLSNRVQAMAPRLTTLHVLKEGTTTHENSGESESDTGTARSGGPGGENGGSMNGDGEGEEDELWLRREVSGRWYLGAICDARRRLHNAVFTS